jgi:1,2-diacylglycerol 3-alpha-glucosyltransferase
LDHIHPDIIAIPGYSSNDALAALSWCKLNHRRAILMTESKLDDAVRSGWKEVIKKTLIHQYDAALCGGQPHQSYLRLLGFPINKIFDGYDVVDNDFFRIQAGSSRCNFDANRDLPGLESSTPFFLASSRFIPRKNLHGLLIAYSEYCRRMQNTGNENALWRLVILGDGAERSSLEGLIHSEGIHGVSLPGFRQIYELPIYLGRASVFIHAAEQEQWGLVVNEAMAAGLPVLVSNRCGCALDLVHQGINGFTFAPDNVGELATLMNQVSAGSVDLEKMGNASREIILDWGPGRFAEGLNNAVQTVIK